MLKNEKAERKGKGSQSITDSMSNLAELGVEVLWSAGKPKSRNLSKTTAPKRSAHAETLSGKDFRAVKSRPGAPPSLESPIDTQAGETHLAEGAACIMNLPSGALAEESLIFTAVEEGLYDAGYAEPCEEIVAAPCPEIVQSEATPEFCSEPVVLILPDIDSGTQLLQPGLVFERDYETLCSPEALPAVETSIPPVIKSCVALACPGPLTGAIAIRAAGEKNDFQTAVCSARDNGECKEIEPGLPVPIDQTISGSVPPVLLEEVPLSAGHGEFERGAAEGATEPAGPDTSTARVEQNLVVKESAEEQPRPKTGGAVDVQVQIGAIMERINDLRSFDVATITNRFDPRIRELRDSANNIIAGILWCNTVVHRHTVEEGLYDAGYAEPCEEIVAAPCPEIVQSEATPEFCSEPVVLILPDIDSGTQLLQPGLVFERDYETLCSPEALPAVETSIPPVIKSCVALACPGPLTGAIAIRAAGEKNDFQTAVCSARDNGECKEIEPGLPVPIDQTISGSVPPVLLEEVPLSAGHGEFERGAAEGATEPAGPDTSTARVEQNLVVKESAEEQPRPKTGGAVDVQVQIGAIMERINDLRSFDVATITNRFDPRIRELRDSANNIIADIFGRNTQAYWHHSLPSFDEAPVVLGGSKPSPVELRRSCRQVINKAVTDLTALAESLQHRVNQSEFRDS
jgi:hypothetical protein